MCQTGIKDWQLYVAYHHVEYVKKPSLSEKDGFYSFFRWRVLLAVFVLRHSVRCNAKVARERAGDGSPIAWIFLVCVVVAYVMVAAVHNGETGARNPDMWYCQQQLVFWYGASAP